MRQLDGDRNKQDRSGEGYQTLRDAQAAAGGQQIVVVGSPAPGRRTCQSCAIVGAGMAVLLARFRREAAFMPMRRSRPAVVVRLLWALSTRLHVGPSSSVRLDKFVYDPNKGTGSVVIDATKGAFRFSTGAQNKGDYKVKTPYGILGVRG